MRGSYLHLIFSDSSNNDTSCAASCIGVDNDISSGDIISNCVVSDTTDITDNGNDIGNSNSSNVNNCKNDKNIVLIMLPVVMVIIVISLVILTVVQFLLLMFHLTLMIKVIKSMTMTIMVP